MLFTEEKSKCQKNQPIVISRDKGESRFHKAINPNSQFDLNP